MKESKANLLAELLDLALFLGEFGALDALGLGQQLLANLDEITCLDGESSTVFQGLFRPTQRYV
jgi:hypothetical protein